MVAATRDCPPCHGTVHRGTVDLQKKKKKKILVPRQHPPWHRNGCRYTGLSTVSQHGPPLQKIKRKKKRGCRATGNSTVSRQISTVTRWNFQKKKKKKKKASVKSSVLIWSSRQSFWLLFTCLAIRSYHESYNIT